MDEELKVKLKSSDNEIFEVEEAVAFESLTIKDFFEEETEIDIVMPLPDISSKVLAQIIDYWNSRAKSDPDTWSANSWISMKFMAQELNSRALFDLLWAADYLDIKKLQAATTEKVADIIKDINLEEIPKNNFTPQEGRK